MTFAVPVSPSPANSLVHVAAASEHRGRIVVGLRSPLPNPIAVSIATDLARLFGARIDAVYLQEQEIFAAAAYSFASEIGFNGRTQGPLDARRLEVQCRSVRTAAFDALRRMTRSADIEIGTRTFPAEGAGVLSRVCADEGPWNIVVLADSGNWPDAAATTALLSGGGATALVVTGRSARRTAGPPLLVVSEPDRLPVMLRTARIVAELGTESVARPVLLPLIPLPTDTDPGDIDLEGTLRLATAAMPIGTAPLILPARAAPSDVTRELATIGKLKPGFVIAHTTSDETTHQQLMRLVTALDCPALIVH